MALLSLSKGKIYTAMGSREGVITEVVRVEAGRIVLSYGSINTLWLPKKNLLVSHRKTPIGSKLEVFVKDFDFALRKIEVTDHLEDSFSIDSFQSIPMFFDKGEQCEFLGYLRDNGWLNNGPIWSIAPVYNESNILSGIIMQNSRNYAFEAMFETIEKHMYLHYKKILSQDEMIKYDSRVNFVLTTYGRFLTSCPNCREKGIYKYRKYGKR